jgi:hypothetical protein
MLIEERLEEEDVKKKGTRTIKIKYTRHQYAQGIRAAVAQLACWRPSQR